MKKFMNPLVDAGFKRIFGRKKYMMEFLNDLLLLPQPITEVTFLDKEMVPESAKDHGVVYDLYCQTNDGKRFVVEMQYRRHKNFKERTVYYMARSITEQSSQFAEKKQPWDYKLMPVYCIYLLNFHLEGKKHPQKKRKVMLMETDSNEVFYDKMTMFFFELPFYVEKRCRKEDCVNSIDKWLYVLVNMNRFETFPFTDDKPIFMQMEEIAHLSTFTQEELRMYERSLDRYATNRLAMADAREEGEKKGRKQGLKEGRESGLKEGREVEARRMAKAMKEAGMPIETIASISRLSAEEIEKL